MKLYGMGKSRSFRALWAMHEAGLKFDYVNVAFGSEGDNGTASKAYKALNSEGKVPTLVDDDLVLIESAAILNYVAAKSSNSHLLPTEDLKARAKYDEMNFFILTELEQGLWTNGKHRFALPEAHRVPDVLNTATFEFKKAVTTLQTKFDGDGFVLGKHFTMSDILLAHTLAWAENFEFKVPERLIDYKNRMYQRQACKDAIKNLE
jgi:glutathione S-transferase